jgi:hypothetical protein
MEMSKRKDSCRLKPPQDHSPRGQRGICCDLAAYASVRLSCDALPDVRRNPESHLGLALQPSVLKHLDEQTVAGLVAVCRAARDNGLNATGFRDWGVLAAPHYPGQSAMVAALDRFRAEGAWGVSPHVIPHHSLHSVSGTVSQVLKIHGPNLGIGGGPGGTGEALLAAAAWIGRRRVPGVWVVLTALEVPGPFGEEGQLPPGSTCLGLALALSPSRPESTGLRLRFLPGDDARRSERPIDLARLQSAVEHCQTARGAGGLVVSAAAPRVELEWGRPGRPLRPPGVLLSTPEIHSAAVRVPTGAEASR